MNLAALVNMLGLVMTVYSGSPCPHHCKLATRYNKLSVKHVSDLQNSSVAPWTLNRTFKEGRVPFAIFNAVCKECIKEDMVSKPIYIQISVYERTRLASDNGWCSCPYKLAVGCTCVMKQQ